MNYSRRVYLSAAATLERRRSNAEQTARLHREEAYSKIPELVSIDREIASAGAEVIRAIGMGENAQSFIDELSKKNLASQQHRKDILKENGYSEDYLEADYTCKKCRDTGFVSGVMCDCYKNLLRDTALAQLNELAPSASATFDRFDLSYYPDVVDPETGINPRRRMEEILSFCKNYAEDFDTESPSLLFYGATGLGKTHLSLAIATEAVKKGFGVIYGSAQNLMSRLEKEHFSNDRTGEFEGSEESMLECDLLIIDDLGAEFSTQFTVAALYNIINTRIMSRLPVIINTNLGPDGLEKKYTQRITSRIIGDYVSLFFCGKDIRQLKNMEQE
ncbi:MAG: ATP-binding protein [Acutalibacteraceae bacterium]